MSTVIELTNLEADELLVVLSCVDKASEDIHQDIINEVKQQLYFNRKGEE